MSREKKEIKLWSRTCVWLFKVQKLTGVVLKGMLTLEEEDELIPC